ncbi:MAG: hypothetical protein GXO62_07705 [Epsilonproteobacteria bacterium]|nr:hypothetical protein [Campylobacterota bacterium]
MKLTQCIVKSLKDLFMPEVLKAVLISGVPVFLFYFGLLYLFWDDIINVAEVLTSWVPFSVLKINGAFFILFFTWFVSVSITFAVITAVFGGIIFNRLQGKSFYTYVIVTITLLSVIYGYLLIINWDYINGEIQRFLTLLPFDTVAKWVGAIVGVYIFYNLFILTLFFILFLFAKPFLDAIAEIEGYEEVEFKGSLIKVLKDIGVFVAFFVVLFPLFFIPVLNVLVQLYLWAKLYRDSFSYFLKTKQANFIAFLSAFFNFLPIINFFAPFFGVILFYHCANSED